MKPIEPMDEYRPPEPGTHTSSMVLAGGILSLASVGAILFLRVLGVVCWVLPVLGLILPILAWPLLWGSALVMTIVSLVLCIFCLREGKAAAVIFIVLDAAILAFFAMCLLCLCDFFLGLLGGGGNSSIIRTLGQLCTDMLGWFFAIPSGLVIG